VDDLRPRIVEWNKGQVDRLHGIGEGGVGEGEAYDGETEAEPVPASGLQELRGKTPTNPKRALRAAIKTMRTGEIV